MPAETTEKPTEEQPQQATAEKPAKRSGGFGGFSSPRTAEDKE